MPAYAPPRRPLLGPLLFAAVGLAVLAAGAAGTAMALGVDLARLWKEPEPDRAGMVPVPTAARKIPANTRVTRDDLIDPVQKRINVTWLPRGAVPEGVVTDFNKIVGRVLKNDKNPTYVFTEKEFHPVGTSTGITAAIPPGKRAFVFESEKVSGLAQLKPGDHCDIIAARAADDAPAGAKLALPGGAAARPAAGRPPTVAPVVQNGVVLTGVTVRQVTTSSTGLTTGTQYKTRPVEEITVAVGPDEVLPLSEALSAGARLTALARSGQPAQGPEPDVAPRAPGPPPPTVTTIETIINGKKETVTFTEPGRPAPAAPPTAKGGV